MGTAGDGAFLFSLPGEASAPTSARLHPAVVLGICDSFIRRNEGQERVIGTLLGSVGPDGVLDIRNSYAVPHNESSDQVAVDIEYHRTMSELNHRVNPKEAIIGWYSTNGTVTASDALIHEFYTHEAPHPILLTLDTAFLGGSTSVRAYVASPLSLGGSQLASQFVEIPLDQHMVEAERVGFENLSKVEVNKLPADLTSIESTVTRLHSMVDTALTYVDDVAEGRRAPDHAIGRALWSAVAAVPRVSAESFDKLFNDSVQDVLLVLYLANLTRAQLAIAEKLNTPALQI